MALVKKEWPYVLPNCAMQRNALSTLSFCSFEEIESIISVCTLIKYSMNSILQSLHWEAISYFNVKMFRKTSCRWMCMLSIHYTDTFKVKLPFRVVWSIFGWSHEHLTFRATQTFYVAENTIAFAITSLKIQWLVRNGRI